MWLMLTLDWGILFTFFFQCKNWIVIPTNERVSKVYEVKSLLLRSESWWNQTRMWTFANWRRWKLLTASLGPVSDLPVVCHPPNTTTPSVCACVGKSAALHKGPFIPVGQGEEISFRSKNRGTERESDGDHRAAHLELLQGFLPLAKKTQTFLALRTKTTEPVLRSNPTPTHAHPSLGTTRTAVKWLKTDDHTANTVDGTHLNK